MTGTNSIEHATVVLAAGRRLANGVVAGYGRTDGEPADGHLDTDTYQLAGYSDCRDDGLYLDNSVGTALKPYPARGPDRLIGLPG